MAYKGIGEPKDRRFVSNGLTLHYVEWGDPNHETWVLVHGNRDQCRSWDFFVSSLFAQGKANLHVVALDLRGHGDSGWLPPGLGYRHEDFLLDLEALFQQLKKDSITLIGHSLGGSMALLFTGSFPAKVRRLVLIEATGPFARSDEETPELLARWLEGDESQLKNRCYPTLKHAVRSIRQKFPLVPNGAAAHMAKYGTKSTGQGFVWKYDPRARDRSFSIFSEGQIQAFIHRIECPTLLILGKESGFLESPRASRVILFKRKKVIEMEGTGHHVPHERPEELARVVVPFLSEG
jgi:pimeloyl-ACP methyl ester carboxylesterase